MSNPIDILFDQQVDWRCVKCGERTCDCWERCTCGWWAERGRPCRNPATARCSSKVNYGKYNRRTKRYE